MILDEEIYLEHYGVKGMKWGIRKDRKRSGETRAKRTSEERKALAKKAGVTTGAAFTAAGAAYLATKLRTQGNVKVSTISSGVSSAHKAEMRKIAEDRIRALSEANEELKRWYNESNTPFPKREFLDPKFWEKHL